MKKALLLAAFAAVLALASCKEQEPDGYAENIRVFKNSTGVAVTLEGYSGTKLEKSWTVEPEKAATRLNFSGYGENGYSSQYGDDKGYNTQVAVGDYEKVRMVFGGTKEMWFKATDKIDTPYNIYNHGNYTLVSFDSSAIYWGYDISEAMMNAAVEITPAKGE